MPIVTAAKRWRKVSWRRDISVAVQNVTDLVRIFLVHACQRESCETLCSRSIKFVRGRIGLASFLMTRIYSRNAEQRCRCKCANKILQTCRKKSEEHLSEL